MNRVFIIAGGNSLKNFDFASLQGEDVIAVNKAIFSAPFAKYFVTMDVSFFVKVGEAGTAGVRRSPATKVFIANLAVPSLKEIDGRFIDTRFQLVYKLDMFDMIVKSRRADGMGSSFKQFRSGSNSGFSALQFAVAIGYTEIYLLGMDMVSGSKETHYHGGYGEQVNKFAGKLPGYFELFTKGLDDVKAFAPDVQIVSCSPISKLNGKLPYIDVNQVLKRRK